ncbi:MAG TPA: RNB domain-containing ribonuclease [Acidimicrobiia bacterium]
MPRRNLRLAATDRLVEAGFDQIRAEMEIPLAFPDQVMAQVASTRPREAEVDLTAIPFVTIDPPGSLDLDQALHLERRRGGFRVHYAIADVGAFVEIGDPVDEEARNRGTTLYAPDLRTPLYPTTLSEGMASLLPDQDRPALVWEIDLDEDGEITEGRVGRALVRSRQQLTYRQVQDQLDSSTASASLRVLAEVGRLRRLLEEERGAVTLPIPEQRVVGEDGGWDLEYEAPLPVENWNAQISLLTGIFAGRMMVDAGIGVLRTLPPAHPNEVERLRRVAKALEIVWPADVEYPDLIRSLDPRLAAHAAFLSEATTLFSGAGYQVLGQGTAPETHAAIAATYAHVTAPLRRLVDRYAGETCLALSAGSEVPDAIVETMAPLPLIMAQAASTAGRYEAACVDLVEAAVMSGREGEVFAGVVVDVHRERPRGEVHLRRPAVHARIDGEDLDLGEELLVRVVEASIPARTVRFEQA